MAKLYYSISEVSELLNEEQHILRYWEKEFKVLKPKKNTAGNRKYSLKDLEILKKIKQLVREQELNLNSAKDIVDNNKVLKINKNLKTNNNLINLESQLILDSINILKSISEKLKQM